MLLCMGMTVRYMSDNSRLVYRLINLVIVYYVDVTSKVSEEMRLRLAGHNKGLLPGQPLAYIKTFDIARLDFIDTGAKGEIPAPNAAAYLN